ncbi:MAG: hypothetical protein ACD_39C00661G0001 [uncultured bacterium]|nr:MAG: hypothetical protein ACD_39C00661G0001 [uncultured bacterium]
MVVIDFDKIVIVPGQSCRRHAFSVNIKRHEIGLFLWEKALLNDFSNFKFAKSFDHAVHYLSEMAKLIFVGNIYAVSIIMKTDRCCRDT